MRRSGTLARVSIFAAGAATMYLLDRNRGRRRRALLRDQVVHSQHELTRLAGKTARDISHHVEGLAAKAGSLFSTQELPDYALDDRVRSAMGHVVSHPGAIDVTSRDGLVTLTGWIVAREAEPFLRAVAGVRGVKRVASRLSVTEHPEHISDLQGGIPRTGRRWELFQQRWSPATRVLIGGVSAGLIGYGIGRRDVPATVLAFAGVGLLSRSVWNRELREIVSRSGPGIDLQKTVRIRAPAAELYQFWLNPQNYAQIFSHVSQVEKVGEGLYHWTVDGPGGVAVGWDGTMVRLIPDKLVEWKSLPGSLIDNAGAVRLDEQGGATRVHIQMTYNPPAGMVGHYLAELLGIDPKHALDDDLVRLKSFFEEGKTRAHGHVVIRPPVEPASSSPSGTGTEG